MQAIEYDFMVMIEGKQLLSRDRRSGSEVCDTGSCLLSWEYKRCDRSRVCLASLETMELAAADMESLRVGAPLF